VLVTAIKIMIVQMGWSVFREKHPCLFRAVRVGNRIQAGPIIA